MASVNQLELACGKLRDKLPQLERALQGQFGAHQRFLVAQQLAHIDGLDAIIGLLPGGGEFVTGLIQTGIVLTAVHRAHRV